MTFQLGLFTECMKVDKSALTRAEVQGLLKNLFDSNTTENVKVYSLVELKGRDIAKRGGLICVKVPGSRLNCERIEQLCESKNALQRSVDNLKEQLDFLTKQMTHNDEVRQAALGTVNLLRQEFNKLMDEATPTGSPPTATGRTVFPSTRRKSNPTARYGNAKFVLPPLSKS